MKKDNYIKKLLLITTLFSSIHLSAEDNILNTLYSKYFNQTLPEININQSLVKEPTLFFFTSTSVPQSTQDNYFRKANKLDTTNYAVYRGLNNDVKRMLIKTNKTQRILVKVHPMMFTDLNITKVPSIVFANCPDKDHFEYMKCEYLYRVDGDISLDEFFEKVASEDDKFTKYSDILNGFSND